MMPALILTLLLAAGASPPPHGETEIPYASSDGIVEWQATADDLLYVRGMTKGWYLVRTSAPCPRMQTAITLGFATSAGGQLDRYGAILAEGRRCPIASVTYSGPPPRPLKMHHSARTPSRG